VIDLYKLLFRPVKVVPVNSEMINLPQKMINLPQIHSVNVLRVALLFVFAGNAVGN